MGLRLKRYGPKLTMAVVGRFPGTGVRAERNVLIDQMKSVRAKTTSTAPSGVPNGGMKGMSGRLDRPEARLVSVLMLPPTLSLLIFGVLWEHPIPNDRHSETIHLGD